MLNIEFYEVERIVDNIIFIISFFIMMKKIGYSYNVKNKFLNLINILLAILLIINQSKIYLLEIDFSISFILLFFICKISYSFDFKKTFIYSLMYNLIYKGIAITFEYIILFTYIFIKYKLGIVKYSYYGNLETIVVNASMFLIALSFGKLKKLSLNKKYYLYIIITIIMNSLIILFLNKASSSLVDLYDVISDNKIKINQSLEIIPFVHFAELALPYIIVASNIVFIFILIKLLKSTEEKAKLELLNKKHDMEYNYYLNIKESQEKVKRLYHDINNHMTNIKLIQNQSSNVDEYINSINNEIKDFENIYNTGNVILDVILSEKSKLCNMKNIDFLCNIDFSKCDFLHMMDVSSIFSNLLDNAIEACDKMENSKNKKYISIRGTIVKSYYIIKCENSKANKVIIKNNKIISSKKDKYFHGIGIESIKSSLKKYDGELEIENEENKFISIIYIPLKQ
ncbi:GHKL domain-containing protein [Terrisporobacter glycolicus]|uniref:GHKL domain-containing protein n=1 Tax=Terrisporobacter glycolicus TaxID=36841 RepID=UPI000A8511BB